MTTDSNKESNKDNTIKAIRRLQAMQEILSAEMDRQEASAKANAQDATLPSPVGVPAFEKVDNKYVDQAKLARIRRGKLAAAAYKEKAQQEIDAWRESFRQKMRSKHSKIVPAGPELVMTYY